MLGQADFSFMGELAAQCACEAMEKVRSGEITSLGDTEDYIALALSKMIEKQGPMIAEKLAALVEPATRKAVDVIKPSVMEALKEYTPIFAAVVGGMIALSVLLGVYTSKKTFQRMSARSAA